MPRSRSKSGSRSRSSSSSSSDSDKEEKDGHATNKDHPDAKEQHVVGQDFSVSGPNDGHFCPETYFDVEVLTRGLVAVKMVWEWRDQGYGNQKGQLWLQLVREGQVLEDNREEYFALAPHGHNSARGERCWLTSTLW